MRNITINSPLGSSIGRHQQIMLKWCFAFNLHSMSYSSSSEPQRPASSSSNTPQQEQNKHLVRQFFEALDKHETERIDQLVSDTNYSLHFSGMPPLDWDANKREFLDPFDKAFPDLTRNIVDIVAEGDKVAVSVNITGTYKGEFQGIPATGKQVSFTAMDILTIIEGKITEEWATADMMGLMQQIGAIPPRSAASSSSTNADDTAKV
jgi:steroid delta-isomerase-like uncharacterized protein